MSNASSQLQGWSAWCNGVSFGLSVAMWFVTPTRLFVLTPLCFLVLALGQALHYLAWRARARELLRP